MGRWLIGALVALAGCGGSTPTSPTTPAPAIVKLGPQLLVIEHHPTTAFCGVPAGTGGTFLVTRVTMQWSGSAWIATATSAASGDVEVRFRPMGTTTAAPFSVTGTITGTAIHQPELFQGVPPWTARVAFAAGGQATVTGTVTLVGQGAFEEIHGNGTGSATVSDGAGIVCPGTSFAWSMYPDGG